MRPPITDTDEDGSYVADVAAPAGRERVGGYVTATAAAGWAAFLAAHGMNMTALLEAVGLALAADVGAGDLPLVAHVSEAHRIEAERLSRKRPPPTS